MESLPFSKIFFFRQQYLKDDVFTYNTYKNLFHLLYTEKRIIYLFHFYKAGPFSVAQEKQRLLSSYLKWKR